MVGFGPLRVAVLALKVLGSPERKFNVWGPIDTLDTSKQIANCPRFTHFSL